MCECLEIKPTFSKLGISNPNSVDIPLWTLLKQFNSSFPCVIHTSLRKSASSISERRIEVNELELYEITIYFPRSRSDQLELQNRTENIMAGLQLVAMIRWFSSEQHLSENNS